MKEIAFDSIISELIWMGIEPNNAHNLASTLYPDEELILNETNIQDWINYIIHLDFDKFNSICPEEDFIDYKDAIEKVKNSNNICRTNIYIDGSNLTTSFQYLKENIEINDTGIVRKVSIDPNNKKIAKNYTIHYLVWCILSAKYNNHYNIFVNNIYFVMCQVDDNITNFMNSIKDKFGFEIIIAKQDGDGYGSCSDEDFILKNKINFDLENDLFDKAIICTGDANNKDGESFISIAKKIEDKNKYVQFSSFGLSTAKKIKNNFNFFDLSEKVLLPRYDGINILIKDEITNKTQKKRGAWIHF